MNMNSEIFNTIFHTKSSQSTKKFWNQSVFYIYSIFHIRVILNFQQSEMYPIRQ